MEMITQLTGNAASRCTSGGKFKCETDSMSTSYLNRVLSKQQLNIFCALRTKKGYQLATMTHYQAVWAIGHGHWTLVIHQHRPRLLHLAQYCWNGTRNLDNTWLENEWSHHSWLLEPHYCITFFISIPIWWVSCIISVRFLVNSNRIDGPGYDLSLQKQSIVRLVPILNSAKGIDYKAFTSQFSIETGLPSIYFQWVGNESLFSGGKNSLLKSVEALNEEFRIQIAPKC